MARARAAITAGTSLESITILANRLKISYTQKSDKGIGRRKETE
jgi:hypothetical protein